MNEDKRRELLADFFDNFYDLLPSRVRLAFANSPVGFDFQNIYDIWMQSGQQPERALWIITHIEEAEANDFWKQIKEGTYGHDDLS